MVAMADGWEREGVLGPDDEAVAALRGARAAAASWARGAAALLRPTSNGCAARLPCGARATSETAAALVRQHDLELAARFDELRDGLAGLDARVGVWREQAEQLLRVRTPRPLPRAARPAMRPRQPLAHARPCSRARARPSPPAPPIRSSVRSAPPCRPALPGCALLGAADERAHRAQRSRGRERERRRAHAARARGRGASFARGQQLFPALAGREARAHGARQGARLARGVAERARGEMARLRCAALRCCRCVQPAAHGHWPPQA